MHNIKDLEQKPSPAIRLKIMVQTDRLNRLRNELSKTFQKLAMYGTPIKAEN